MASFDRTFSASPVLVMPSQSIHQSPFGAPAFLHQGPSFNNFSAFGSNAALPQSYVSPSTSELRGRKRSRDEASENLDDRASAVTAKLEQPEEGRVHADAASSQSGTWVDEKADLDKSQKVKSTTIAVKQQDQDRPFLRSHKSQRLDSTSPRSAQDLHSNGSTPTRDAANSSTPVPSLSLDATATPVVDDFTVAFGIGWRLMKADSNMSAAVRGWARYIENHYPVSNVRMHAESKGLQSYLIEANEGWFLFDENLRQGRLVGTDNQRCIQNLKSSPPVFEGAETMTAAASPRAVSPFPQPAEMDTDMN